MREILIVLNFLVMRCLAADGPAWSYTNSQSNPNTWNRISPAMCSGWAQSPINLDSKNATYLGESSEAVVDIVEQSTEGPSSFIAINNGHSLLVRVPRGRWKITLNAAAKNYYVVDAYHFHWGGANDRGSEHTLDGRSFPLEMHIVAYSSMYTGSSTAPSAPGGLAVIGVFFQLTTDQSNSSLSKMGDLLSLVSRLRTSGSETEMQPLDLRVVLPKSRDQFFRYYGSLTTPPCTENVQWTVMRDPLYVTTAELEVLRSLQFGSSDDRKPMQDNFRPVQMLNPVGAAQPRVLYKSWSAASRPVAASLSVFALCLALFMISV